MDSDKIISSIDSRLRNIEISVSGMEAKLDGLSSWMESRDKECQELEKKIQALGISTAKHGVYVTLISIFISSFIAASITYFINTKPRETAYHVEPKK